MWKGQRFHIECDITINGMILIGTDSNERTQTVEDVLKKINPSVQFENVIVTEKKDKIEPGMIIHCKTSEEIETLLKELEKLGYLVPNKINVFEKEANIALHEGNAIILQKHISFGHEEWNVEFSEVVKKESGDEK